ncbi:MAG: hypothetical protein A3F84_23365 [Candidatus Handelsmanbacteria bacterium RIFCSPLOWO2_12_FULL_64_10]|uniref:Guanylate cyclase domain-containing protein n=1 Tax=Handelsmanbacteria sp. (strain RIFCSPLOWO2_12_FULL_64_10) TaxID=1817868 RepID=A0A1F6CTF8_HANXR|nr:MAG: hypothetical protein A3F84_23365 [Candidatus Handelsmanbacteria bacterium RIFCSPLOWO2_12_FULL_64_10]
MKFCGGCGAPLKNLCPKCGFENPPQFRFCGGCGTSLRRDAPAGGLSPAQTDRPAQVESRAAEQAAPEGERRQLTVMFCDLVGSTALSEQLDPEELREVVRAYQQACGAVIRRFEGHIAQYLGDGLLVYFGYPQAHEDDAQRAVRAGLGIVEAVRQLNVRPDVRARHAVPVQVRVGIHTGLVVVGEMGGGDRRESLALGETPNLAARLQEMAEPDTVVVSDATHRLIEGFFGCEGLDARSVKGVSQAVEAYRVLHESAARSRLEAMPRAGLTPLVGREQELSLLLDRWERTKEGAGQVVLLVGEAGIGKSRLVQVLKEEVAKEPEAWLTPCQCSPYHQNSAFYPVIDLFERVALRFERVDTPQQKLDRLEGFLAQYGFSLPETVPLFASLLSVPFGERYSPLNLSPDQQKQRMLQAILKALMERASQQPVLLVVEDLHWVDPSTLELLSLLMDRTPTARILVMFTFRPEFSPPWPMWAHLTQMTLTRLAHRQVAVMVERVTGGKGLPGEVLQQVVDKTDGVPLFVEELTKMVLESGLLVEREDRYELTGPLPPLAIPSTLQDSLTARLDRLSAVKEIAQLGAVLGREFGYETLRAVSTGDETTLQRGLAQLVEAELLYERGLPPQATYIFKHALVQEAAYQSLLKSRRQQFHQRIAQVLEERFPETVEAQPELIAHHYTEAGLSEQAVPCWQRAGERAVQRSAYLEAIHHLQKGLELLKTLPDSPEHIQRELDLQIALGPALIAIKGYAALEVERVYIRARALCQQVDDNPLLFRALWGLWVFYIVGAKHQTARELAEQLLSLAQRKGDPALLLMAHLMLGDSLFFLGEFVSARKHDEQGIALYDPQQHRSLAFLYIHDPGQLGRSIAAWTFWCLGYPDQALQHTHEALTLSQEMSHPHSLALTLYCAALLHQFRREVQAAQERAEALMALATEQGFSFFVPGATILQGWVLAEQGQGEEGMAQMHQGLDAWQAMGAEVCWRGYFLGLLAEVYGKVGQPEEGLNLLAEALALVNKTGERHWEAEWYRIKGELLLMQAAGRGGSRTASTKTSALSDAAVGATGRSPLQDDAEACFLQAIEVARGQQAKSLELRATVSLCRLWQGQGKKAEARQMLAEIYGWFTEGFDTADLKEAKALLDELA